MLDVPPVDIVFVTCGYWRAIYMDGKLVTAGCEQDEEALANLLQDRQPFTMTTMKVSVDRVCKVLETCPDAPQLLVDLMGPEEGEAA